VLGKHILGSWNMVFEDGEVPMPGPQVTQARSRNLGSSRAGRGSAGSRQKAAGAGQAPPRWGCTEGEMSALGGELICKTQAFSGEHTMREVLT